ncbi:Olah [Symbiodinium natans]|uniref:Olah protein n=1 Tax=Symbiodinium natans TaxID=878477 RepID=A0A812J5T4_9DINO|nr:Olah [Symbiodinium natans]
MEWEVTGGADKGGILVREGQALTSKACDDRLSTGASVKELQLVGDRLCYELLTGTGPKTGWVSVKISGKELVVRKAAAPVEAVKMPDFEKLDESYPSMKKGASPTGKTPWLKMLGKANENAKGRLVIFSWTGNRGGQGSAHNFMKPASPAWAEHLKSFQQYEVNYPGRGTRVKDPLYEDPVKYVQDIASALQEALKDGLPFVLLGFSFGSVLAMEVARSLQAKDMGPLAVVAVSAEAPQWPGRSRLGLANLGEARFEQMLKDKGGTEFILQDPGMKKMFVPVITADCKLEENYRFDASAGPLKCPLLVFYGKKEGHDKMKTVIDAEAVEAWMELTACPKLSKLQALESDWYVFQDAGATEAVAVGTGELCKDKLEG